MIQINTNTPANRINKAFDTIRPVIITTGNKHVITSKGTKYEVPLSLEQRVSRGNTR